MQAQEAPPLLAKLSARLDSISRISYHYRRELNYSSENFHHVLEGDVAIEFDPHQQASGALYQAHDPTGFEVFNGSEILRGVTKTHTLQMTAVRSASDLDRVSFLYNSLVTLRRALPKILADPAIAKSVAERTESSYAIDIRIPRAVLNATGTLSPITLERTITYRITVDAKTGLPTSVRQSNNQNADFTLVEFSNLNEDPPKLPAESWLYTSYKDYRLEQPGPARKLLPTGSVAPQWTLPLSGGGKTVSLADTLRDSGTRLLLVEFWISHCGYSIDAVPHLNELAKRFAPEGLSVIAINADDDDDTIRAFAKSQGPQYPLVAGGGDTAIQYGVSGYPTIFLIDPKGTIVYAGGFDHEALIAKIAALLKDSHH